MKADIRIDRKGNYISVSYNDDWKLEALDIFVLQFREFLDLLTELEDFEVTIAGSSASDDELEIQDDDNVRAILRTETSERGTLAVASSLRLDDQ